MKKWFVTGLLDYSTIKLTVQITIQYRRISVLNSCVIYSALRSYNNPLQGDLIVLQSFSSSSKHRFFCPVQYPISNKCHLNSTISILLTTPHIRNLHTGTYVKVCVVVLCLLKVHIAHPSTFAGLYFHLCPCQSVQATGHHEWGLQV